MSVCVCVCCLCDVFVSYLMVRVHSHLTHLWECDMKGSVCTIRPWPWQRQLSQLLPPY